jgi:hypothetical protein
MAAFEQLYRPASEVNDALRNDARFTKTVDGLQPHSAALIGL